MKDKKIVAYEAQFNSTREVSKERILCHKPIQIEKLIDILKLRRKKVSICVIND